MYKFLLKFAHSKIQSMNLRLTNYRLFIPLFILFIVVIGFVLYISHIATELSVEEQKRMELWAEATRQLIQADEDTDIDFITQVIEGNTTIPVYMLEGIILLTRNVHKPVADPTRLNGPIEVRIADDIVQYIYYDESTLLYQLRYLPYIQMVLIVVFIAIAILVLITTYRSEQNRVWVGLSKETAHQLGTPISSLNAWQQILEEKYPSDPYVPEMRADIQRLETIADRFSKIGSTPELTRMAISPVIEDVTAYMRSRISKRITLEYIGLEEHVQKAHDYAMLNRPLFAWVIENLIRNAVDAIDKEGTITLRIEADDNYLYVYVSDTGRGIERRKQRRIFNPGYTTKQRGWGLGLSLSKRIVEDYHRGKLTLKSSQVGKGTTFRIRLKQAVDR